MSGETAAERWSPIQRVESVLLSIISLLDDAECSSPANVDAGVMLRKNPEEFKALVQKDVKLSQKDIPEGFIMPTHEPPHPAEKADDPEFWFDSGEEEGFGGSDTDGEMEDDEGDESPDQESGNEEEDDEMLDGKDENEGVHRSKVS